MQRLQTRIVLTAVAALSGCHSTLSTPTPAASSAAPLALRGATIVDVVQGQLLRDRTLVIAGTRVRSIARDDRAVVPAGTRTVDARGKYVILGLWDMHVHVIGWPEVFYPLLIANGVTGIRDMGTPIPLDTVHRWQREVAVGTRVGPRQLNAGHRDPRARRASGCRCAAKPPSRGQVSSAPVRRALWA